MAFDLGDPIPLVFHTVDATGAPANVTTAVLTITLPDLTTVTPTVAVGVVGTYAPTTPYISTLAGIHRVSWVGSGANAQDYSDVFNVLAADPGFIISLADARRGIRSVGTATDEDLRDLISDATPIMEYLVGPILRTSRIETYDGGGSKIVLLWSPVISISSMLESYGNNVRTLTLQDPFAGTGQDGYGYTVDLASGIVTRRSAGVARPFALGKRNVQVSYVSGRTVVGGNVLRATRMLIRHLWQIENGRVPLVNGQPEATTLILGYAVPNAVVEMCGGDIRGPSTG
jgi:hypothetical protein